MAELDETSRFALKQVAVAEQLAWVVADLDPDFAFARWLDTLAIAFPGEAERRCDTVAELLSRSGTRPPWALVLEVEADLKRMTAGRMLEYEGRLLREVRHGPHGKDTYPVAGLVLFLSGIRGDLVTEGLLPGTDLGGVKRYRAWCLEAFDALTVLGRISRGELGRSILMWVPLMRGGDRPEVVAEWLQLVLTEPDVVQRAVYAAVALIFADWRGRREVWASAVEGFDVEQIEIVKRWKDKARAEGEAKGRAEGEAKGAMKQQQENLKTALRVRFPAEPTDSLTPAIDQTHDTALLRQWFELALSSASWSDVRAAIQPPAANGNGQA